MSKESRKANGITIFTDDCPICKIGKVDGKECSNRCFLSTDHGCQKMVTMPRDPFNRAQLFKRLNFWIQVIIFIDFADNSIFTVKNRAQLHKKLVEIDLKFFLK
jgi:hypothetical protein